jgi:hypothetical protein
MDLPSAVLEPASLDFAHMDDLVELYFERGWTDGLPVVPPTPVKVDAVMRALGGDPTFVECRVAPRWGALTREVLAINMVMAGCKPEYAGVVRAATLALTQQPFNLNGVQATTHVAAPLLIVNGPVAREIGMNGGANAFGSGNRANATIGRAVRLIMLNVGGGRAPDLDKCTLGNPAKYTYCVCENEEHSPLAPYHVEHGYAPDQSTVFAMAAEAPHSVTDHYCNDPEGILDTMCSAMSTIASNTAVLSGHCVVVLASSMPVRSPSTAGPATTSKAISGSIQATALTRSRAAIATARFTIAIFLSGTSASRTAASRSLKRPIASTCSSSVATPGAFQPSFPAGAT